jgi:dCTP deaminase
MSQLGNVLTGQKIASSEYITNIKDTIQPSSCDLNFEEGAKLLTLSGIPSLGPDFNVEEFLREYTRNDLGTINSTSGPILEPKQIYCIKLGHKAQLPKNIAGQCDTKSTYGRSDILSYVIGNGFEGYSQLPYGYNGDLHMILVPNSFAMVLTSKTPVTQVRLWRDKRKFCTRRQLSLINFSHPLLTQSQTPKFTGLGLSLELDLMGTPPLLEAHPGGKPIYADKKGQDGTRYFREVRKDSQGNIFLEPGKFVLAKTLQRVRIPRHLCAEVTPYMHQHGEIRWHYAGFIDPAFGLTIDPQTGAVTDDPTSGNVIVLEIRNMSSVPIILSHGQKIARLRYEIMEEIPPPYGKNSHYTKQKEIVWPKFFAS